MAFSLIYTIKDGKDADSTIQIYLPSSTAFADVALFAGEMAKLLNPMIGGAITRIGVAYTVPLPAGLRTTPSATSDVEEGARFQYRTSGGFFSANRIPTFNESAVQAGTRTVNQADANVAAFITAMVNGINLTGVGGSGTVGPSDAREEDITAVDTAREMFQSSRKGE